MGTQSTKCNVFTIVSQLTEDVQMHIKVPAQSPTEGKHIAYMTVF